jgi:hypothetical protein
MFDSQRLSAGFAGMPADALLAPGVDVAADPGAAQPVRIDTNHVTNNQSFTRESSFASSLRYAGLLSNIKYTQALASYLAGNTRTMHAVDRPYIYPMTTRSNVLAAGAVRMRRVWSARMSSCNERCVDRVFWSNAK